MKKFDWDSLTLGRWLRGWIAVLVYVLVVIWIGNYCLLLGAPIVFDIYITKYIPWGFWKKSKDGKKPHWLIEWLDAIVFALVAVYFINLFLFQNYKIPTSSLEKSLLVGDHLFVSKVSYGPRMPNAPIAMPLTQNTLPIFDCKSYLEWPMWGYKRLAGLGKVERNDIVVFNFPAGDTVCVNVPNPDYYSILLNEGVNYVNRSAQHSRGPLWTNTWERNHYLMGKGRERVWKASKTTLGDIVSRPVDKRDCYVKRCIALPGDTLEIRHNEVFINGKHQQSKPGVQHNYYVTTNGTTLNNRFFETLEISEDDKRGAGIGPNYYLPLTDEKAEMVRQNASIKSIVKEELEADSTGLNVFPFSPDYPWSRDNYGPIWMPRKGATVALDEKNAVLYERIIGAYEGHSLDVRDGKVFVDGVETQEYTFEMDYYFMLGDNRHKSADSRYWGFVPEDHVVGKPILVWLSLNPDKGGFSAIRWERFFKFVE